MKKIGCLLLFLALSSIMFGQNVFKKSIKQLKKQKGVTVVNASGFVTQLASIAPFTGLSKDEKTFLKRTKHLVVLKSEGENKVDFYQRLKADIEENNFNQLLSINKEEGSIRILTRSVKGGLSDLVVIKGGQESTFIHLQGKFDAQLIWELMNN